MRFNDSKVGYYLERTTRIVKLKFTQLFSEMGLDLTPEQWVILDNLYNSNGRSQIDLATNSFKNAPTVSRIIDLLAKKELVERRQDDNDRRVYKIYLTTKGRDMVDKLLPRVKEIRNASWKNLKYEDYQEFIRIINQVFDNMENWNKSE